MATHLRVENHTGPLPAASAAVLLLAGCAGSRTASPIPGDVFVSPALETAPTPSGDDAADDPAIWVHPNDPARSLILGSDKAEGLGIYDLRGDRVGFLAVGSVNNVDVSVLDTANGEIPIAAGTARDENTVAVWTIDPDSRELSRVDGGRIVSRLPDVYGFALARFEGATHALVTSKAGMLEVIELTGSAGRVDAGARAELAVGGQLEGVVADPGNGSLYIGEEGVGIWRYTLAVAPDGTIDWEETASRRRLIDTCRDTQGTGNLTSDVEGLTIWAPDGSEDGYLVASSQGDDRFCVYDRRTSAFVGSFRILDHAGIDGVTHTDGIGATARPIGPDFPRGVFVAQDDDNSPERQNFKVVDWRSIERALRLPPD